MAAGVLKAKFGSNYEVGSAAKMLYPASGDKKTTLESTGRQLPPLSSVLYGIILRRRSVLAAQLLLREKSGA